MSEQQQRVEFIERRTAGMSPFDAPTGAIAFVDGTWPTKAEIAPHANTVWNEYVDYGRTVSTRGMAVNAMTAGLFLWACKFVQAKAVCDLGSGFSSYVAARYARDHGGVVVASVDDEPEWLARTRRFLLRHRVSPAGLTDWDAWDATDTTFDVILHDFNCGERRNATMWTAAERLNPGGLLVFDDAQHDLHHAEMKAVCEHYGWRFVPLYDATSDETNRFAALAVAS
jgi:predicted O-methyltransferase YrrM